MSRYPLDRELFLLPPSDEEAEAAACGAILASEDALFDCITEAQSTDFFVERHAAIWAAAETLHAAGSAVNQITVANVLSRRGQLEAAGGQTALAELVLSCPTTIGAAHYARIVRAMATHRALIWAAALLAQQAQQAEADPADIALGHADRVVALSQRNRPEEAPLLAESVPTEFDGPFRDWLADPSVRRGVPTGIGFLDRILGGWLPTRLHIVGADTSAGKSTFAQHAALAAAAGGYRVLLCTTEMSRSETTERLLGMTAGVNPLVISIRGHAQPVEEQRLNLAMGELANLPVRIREGGLALGELRALVRRLCHRRQVDLVIIDHLDQMHDAGHRSREEMLGSLTAGLKDLATASTIPIIAVSHLNREGQHRRDDGQWPRLADLFGASAKERDANVVILLSAARQSPEGWTPMTREEIDDLPAHKRDHVLRIHLAKNRHGVIGPAYVWLNWSQGGRFHELGHESR